jgi:hypothetical protein
VNRERVPAGEFVIVILAILWATAMLFKMVGDLIQMAAYNLQVEDAARIADDNAEKVN